MRDADGRAAMADGSTRLPNGTYVRVQERGPTGREYIGRVVGTDLGRSKYEIGERYGGWGRWLFAEGGAWAFPREVRAVLEADALTVPAVDEDICES